LFLKYHSKTYGSERVGVCRDFAPLAVAFCRCMNIPARYANGFLGTDWTHYRRSRRDATDIPLATS
jgi:transglutaminase-like putative cysteine protease